MSTALSHSETAPLPAERPFDPALDPPGVLYLALPESDVCNYRCRHCHIWMQTAASDPLSRARRIELVREFGAWNPRGMVVVPGGEVTLDLEELFAVAGACREQGLPCWIVTNGSRIDSPEVARAVVESGITNVSVSLDSHLPELHDYTRGLATAFAEATRAIRLLAAARDRHAPAFRLVATAVLFQENLPLFADYVEFCRGLGVDHVDFQMLARTFSNRHPSRDVFFEKHFWHAPEAKRAAKADLAALLERYATDPFVVKKPADFDWIARYVDDPDFRTERPVCGSHYQNLVVDAAGNAALCFVTRKILADPFAGNARTKSLREVWSGAKAEADRDVMDACTLNCGALNCHRRTRAAA